ncbi:MAG: hypothetical protein F6K28_20950 [Microcoleus sp. SIO2G3]|nr:hypothetical protein [Microcoleus sp. SIO2G3]
MKENSPTIAVTETLRQEPPLPCNWDAVHQLQEENKLLATGWVVTAAALTIAMAMTAPLTAPGAGVGLAAMQWTQWRAGKVARILQVMMSLLEKFESRGVEIYQRIPIDGMNPIDLFIRFPQIAHIIVSIRSKGNTEIVYNEATEEVRVRKKNGTTSRWQPNPLVELADKERWLAKNRWRFGMSSKEAAKTPTAKVLVLCSPTKADEHREELYSEVGTVKTLAIRRKGTAFVIQQEELLDFVAAWLARHE